MTRGASLVRSAWGVAMLVASIATVHAQAPAEFAGEPDKSMASAGEALAKGDTSKAAEYIGKAAAYVRAQEQKVAKDASMGLKKAADELDRLGAEVKKGAVKSADALKKTFAKTDHALATAWHATADQEQKAGKDASGALRSAGAGLENAAKWAGTKLDSGAQAAVDALNQAERGARMGAEAVGRTIRGLGDGISDLGRRIGG